MWYGQGKQQIEWCSGTALWYRGGQTPLPIRWVVTRDPEGKHEPRAYFSTDQTQSGLSIIIDVMKRWCAEVTFEESRAHLGVETQRQWSDLAIERMTPCLFGLYSLVALLGQRLHPTGDIPFQHTAWYRKQTRRQRRMRREGRGRRQGDKVDRLAVGQQMCFEPRQQGRLINGQ